MARWTDKQKIFVMEYLVDFNATRSAIKAGYSKKTATAMGSENLRKPHIKAKISEELKLFSEECTVRRFKVLKELEMIAFSRLPDLLEQGKETAILKSFDEMTEAQKACLMEYRESYYDGDISGKNFKLYDKQKALDTLLKHCTDIEEKTKTGEDGELIEAMAFMANLVGNAYEDRSGNDKQSEIIEEINQDKEILE